eukprot:TRINITY_DN41350_c0_g1_i1.p1 TRINITY_DN41350_c0_g1~~TRINITY_DN41350_c0_g1_i1.p1  ORF type:complete len:145 (+),score=19.85 TRINITY_DN41350_c0_g1_i1:39-473(+)
MLTAGASPILLALVCLDALGVLLAGLYAFARKGIGLVPFARNGSKVSLVASCISGALLVVLFLVQVGVCCVIAGLLAVMMWIRFSQIYGYENNKTVRLAREMKIPLMTEEEEDLQIKSKKIYFAMTLLSAGVCIGCGLRASHRL